MAEQPNHPRHLTPSELGTKEYWESFYENSLAHLSSKRNANLDDNTNTSTNHGDDGSEDEDVDDDSDPGTSWFTEHNAPEKVLDFLTGDEFPLSPINTSTTTPTNTNTPSILDVGTGNGSMLKLLRDEGEFSGSMVGIDYSVKSIELARRLNTDSIRFEVFDILDRGGVDSLFARRGGADWFPHEAGGFDIVLDKGTFDAISLSDEKADGEGEGERICERYPGAVARFVRKGGYFVITSCNWTESELVEWFTGEKAGDEFVVYDRVEYPKFRFGGQEGQGVCTVCFQRK